VREVADDPNNDERPVRGGVEANPMYARVTHIRFPPSMRAEVVGVAQGLVPVLREQQGYEGLNVLTDGGAGEGLIISYWETQADAEASEASSSYIGQMSMMSSFLQERLIPKTYEASVHA
jgi:heme-degrading monooxygenase HmoA